MSTTSTTTHQNMPAFDPSDPAASQGIVLPKVVRIQDIIDKVTSIRNDADTTMLQKAYVFSASRHAGQVRLSGEPYLSHPLAVAYILAEMRMDEATIAAGLLHDTVEDTGTTVSEIDSLFGKEVAHIVDGVSKISLMKFESKEEAQAENIRKMIMAMAEDIRVLMVKLADRLHNMRTLEFQKPHKQTLIAQETMDIYVPLANRLGLYRIKLELEDLSFMYLKPDIYTQMTDWLDKNYTADHEYIARIKEKLHELLSEHSINAEILGRIKHKYSIYKKMLQQSLTLDQVHDILAFRIIVTEVKSCYAVLGLVHAEWKPVQGRFKDYISMPKANMYQSLHTTVVGPEGERFEIQIRTWEMDRLAEHGIASHWRYKEGGGGHVKPKDAQMFTWLHELLDWQKQERDSREFMHTLRFDMFRDEIYVFTPRGDVLELPEGATPIDFAYQIHSKVGSQCSGAKINGRLVPITSTLKSGDTIEIITDPHRHPSRDWLKFVKTAKARTHVNNYIRTEERSRSISLGREMLEKQGRRMGVNVQKLKDAELLELAKELSFKSVEEMFSAIGYARITPRKVLNKYLPKAEQTHEPTVSEEMASIKRSEGSEGVVVTGVDDMLVRFGRCCNPLPGDPIVGYISRGRGITVHTSSCVNIEAMEPERLIPVHWQGFEGKPYPARINIVSKNEFGVLAKIATIFADRHINIDSGAIRSQVDGTTSIDFTVEVKNVVELYQVIDLITKVPNVIEVTRHSGSSD